MAECSYARCQNERRAIRKELQRWTKNMVYILGLERVAEELMGRRKWKLYQDGVLPRRSEPERSSDDESMPASDGPPPALKIKTIEQINAPDDDERPRTEPEPSQEEPNGSRRETILESLIRKPATQPKLEYDEPADWKPQDKCYFCVDGERSEGAERVGGGANSPASESDSSSVSGAKSPAVAPPLLQHLLQLQAQNPQAIAQFQQMMATLAALGTGLVPPALQQAWMLQRLQMRQPVDRLPSESDKVGPPESSPSPMTSEQPLDLSAKSSSTGGSPPPLTKNMDGARAKMLEGASNCVGRRAYTEDELQSALRDIQSGKLGTRRAAVVYGIPRSTLRNKVYKLASDCPPGHDSEPDSEPDRDRDRDRDSPTNNIILKIPTFPIPDDKSPSPAAVTTPVTPLTPMHQLQACRSAPAQLLLPASVFADPPSSQHIFTSINDVIAKSISQKFQQPLDRSHHLPGDLPFLSRAPDRHVSVIKTPPENNRGYPAAGNSRAMPGNNGQQAAGGKGTRPKRGKYRNYDRDSLVEAVKAVQRGEMSVHRAGSYYGVPHSTLEYKVKERHLMRPRKREPKAPQDPAMIGKPQPPKPQPPKPPTKPFSNGMNGPDGPNYASGYPFWPPPGFAPPPHTPELYASHMMRRLREEAPPPANGSFLEGIIRSSLERQPGTALLQRLTAEPRVPGAGGGGGGAGGGGAGGTAGGGAHDAPSLLRRLAGGGEAGGTQDEDSPPPARRTRIDSSDRQLAAEMREAVQRLRADKLRPRNGTPTPPAPAAAALSPPPAPPDRP